MKRSHDGISLQIILIQFLACLLYAGPVCSEDYTKWSHSLTIVLNTSSTGADIQEDLTAFPLLIKLNQETFTRFSQTQPGGADIRFAKSDGTHMPYQIGRWVDHTGDNDTAEIWVLVDTVYGNDTRQQFRMYWGRSGAVDSSRGSAVFDTAHGFRGVWHLDEDKLVTDGSFGFNDATAHAYNAASINLTTLSDTAGIIGRAQSLDGKTNAIMMYSTVISGLNRFTVSFWIRTVQNGAGTTDIASPSLLGFDITGTGADDFGLYSNNGYLGIQSGFDGNTDKYWTSPHRINDNAWHFVTAAYNGTDVRLYLDGIHISEGNELHADGSRLASQTISLGAQIYDGINRYFHSGIFDEVVFSGTARSADWIKLCYENQKNGSVLTSVIEPHKDLIITEPADTIAAAGGTASFSVIAQGEGTLRYTWTRISGVSSGDISIANGNGASLDLTSVMLSDNGTRFRCIVRDDAGIDSSRWALLTVIDTPRITSQPHPVTVTIGSAATFSLSVKDTVRVSYTWHTIGNDAEIGTLPELTIATSKLSDTGRYYCVVSNPAGTVTSDTVTLTVLTPPLSASFTMQPETGCAPLRVAFSDQSGGIIASRNWKFGDGGSDTAANPVHLYTVPGQYSVSLTIKGTNENDSSVIMDSVYVFEPYSDSVNVIVLDTVFYDSLADCIRLSACVPPDTLENRREIGITCAIGQYPTDTTGCQVVRLDSCCIDTVIHLSEPVYIGATYYISLWYRAGSGAWITPTVRSQHQVHIGSPLREVVTFFDPETTNDTISAFNGRIKLWKDRDYTLSKQLIDTLDIVTLTRMPAGLLPVGTPFRFNNRDASDPLYIGIRVDSLPPGTLISEVHIYNEQAGTFFVNYESTADIGNGYVYVKTSDRTLPFIAMLDTAKPSIIVIGDTASPVVSTALSSYAINITDNIANVQWQYFYGRGDRPPKLYKKGIMQATETMLSLEVADTSEAISRRAGLWALLITDDGSHSDTLNLSRTVYSPESDTFTTDANVWNPIYSTAILDTRDAGPFVRQVLGHYGITAYDPRYMRLYRWCDIDANRNQQDKWVEYHQTSNDVQSLFTFEPGRIMWLKTSENIPLHLSSGYTLSLKDTFCIDLPPQQWTDFGMPFRFGVRIGDILSASDKDAETISWCRWIQDASTKLFTLYPVYVPGMPDKTDRSQTIEYLEQGGYSFYNPGTKKITLRIPPTPSTNTNTLAKRATASASWSTKFIALADNSTLLPPVYFGYAAGTNCRSYPPAPSFLPLRLSVIDRNIPEQYGHYIDDAAKNGFFKELLITNSDDTMHTVCFHLEPTGMFPETYSAACCDASVHNPDTFGTINIPPQSEVSRWIIVGDAAFQQKFTETVTTQQYALYPPYSLPCRSSIIIRYAIPLGAMEQVAITIYNILGKKVWEKRMNGLLTQGIHEIVWDGKDEKGCSAGSGLYIIRCVIEDRQGKVIKRYERHTTLLKG